MLHRIGAKECRATLRLKASFLSEVDRVGFGHCLYVKTSSSGAED